MLTSLEHNGTTAAPVTVVVTTRVNSIQQICESRSNTQTQGTITTLEKQTL